MKFKILFILITGFLLLNQFSFSQEQRFIQVVVTENISLAPLQITYQVSTTPEINMITPSLDSSFKSELPTSVKISDVDKMLGEENFSNRDRGTDYTITNYSSDQEYIFVKLSTVSELKRLHSYLKNIKGVTGKVIAIDFESPEPQYKKLYEKLYNKALNEVSILAGFTGNEVGRLISTTEVKDEMNNYLGMLMEYYKSIPPEMIANNPDLSRQVPRTMQFKFELK